MKKQKKSAIGPTVVLTTAGIAYVLSGGVAKADPNEGVIDIQSFLNSQAAVDDPIRIARFSDSFLKFISSGFSPSGESHNVTSYFGGQDNLFDQRPADNNEPFYIRLIHNGTTETKTSKVNFSFPSDPDYMFGNKPIIFDSDRIQYGPVVDVRKAINQNSGDLPLKDVPSGTSGEYGTGVLDIGTRLLADLNDNGIVNFVDFAILANYWKNHNSPTGVTSSIANITGPNGIPDGYNGKAVVDELDLGAFAEEWLMDVNSISQVMQTLPKELYERMNETASYILNHIGDEKVICKYHHNQAPTLSGDMITRLSKHHGKLEQNLFFRA